VRIAVLPGDGIGVEVTAAASRVLRAVRPDLEMITCDVGGAACERHGEPLPEQTLETCKTSAAILFGAVGDPRYDEWPAEKRPERAILGLRKIFDLFANLRPVKLIAGLEEASSLRPELLRELDLIVVRETTSGLYFGQPKKSYVDENGVEAAIDTLIYRAPEIERVARVAFELARGRRRRVTSIDKMNVLETGRLWRRVVTRVHADYADVELDHMLVDNAAMQLIRDPQRFDVIVTENTFGDILSDEAAMLTGSLGNLPSATLGTKRTSSGQFGLYEPISGTAPDIAGKGIANPIAAILSAALLCRHSLGDEPNATRIEAAVAKTIASGARTRDLVRGGAPSLGTEAFTDKVAAELV
jgi:3-isopropylmalate dehydrogenase